MKKQMLFLLLSLVTSIYAMDRRADLIVNIEKKIIAEIDSIEYIPVTKKRLESNSTLKANDNQLQYSFYPIGSKSVIVLKLKNKSVVRSQQIEMAGFVDNIYVSKKNDKYFIGKSIESKSLHNTIMILVAIVIIFITKLPITLLFIKPQSTKKYLLKVGVLNMIYLLLLITSIVVRYQHMVYLLLATFIFMIILDSIFYVKTNKENRSLKAIVASLISNLLLITVGLFALSIIAVFLDPYF